jgi:NAD(P)-dependent dehydrogenase (short-subunit alcohol dehydrogenase family)
MPPTKAWTAVDLPNLSGRVIVVTGGNSGIGFHAAAEFANKGASVVLACRSIEKARAAAAQIIATHPRSSVEVSELDLANLESVRNFARAFRSRHKNLDVLCNNAGVMALPYRRTADGFEMQFGTNHLGHFALTGLLLESLLRTEAARVVTVSSSAGIGWAECDSTICSGNAATLSGSPTDRASSLTYCLLSNSNAGPGGPG